MLELSDDVKDELPGPLNRNDFLFIGIFFIVSII